MTLLVRLFENCSYKLDIRGFQYFVIKFVFFQRMSREIHKSICQSRRALLCLLLFQTLGKWHEPVDAVPIFHVPYKFRIIIYNACPWHEEIQKSRIRIKYITFSGSRSKFQKKGQISHAYVIVSVGYSLAYPF